MALIDQFTLSEDQTFKNKIQAAVVRAASTAINNNVGTQIDAARRVLQDIPGSTELVARLVQNDSTVAASAPTGGTLTDAQIQSAVNQALQLLVR